MGRATTYSPGVFSALIGRFDRTLGLALSVLVDDQLGAAEERASRDAKLSTITIVSRDAFAPSMEVFELRRHILRVECKFDNVPPAWDTLPGYNPPGSNS